MLRHSSSHLGLKKVNDEWTARSSTFTVAQSTLQRHSNHPFTHIKPPMGCCCHARCCQPHWEQRGASVLTKDTSTCGEFLECLQLFWQTNKQIIDYLFEDDTSDGHVKKPSHHESMKKTTHGQYTRWLGQTIEKIIVLHFRSCLCSQTRDESASSQRWCRVCQQGDTVV